MKGINDIKKLSCRLCASRCGMLLHTQEERLVKVEGDQEHPVSRGWSCAAGRASMAERHRILLLTS
jgi:anaerobic selenocysteine-containing dehydrogenase